MKNRYPPRGSLRGFLLLAAILFSPFHFVYSQSPTGPGSAPLPGPVPVAAPPVIASSSEKVEMERLRVVREAESVSRVEAAFREQVALLQKKLLSSSIEAGRPQSLSSAYPTYINLNASDVESAEQYHELLTSTLNDLIPKSPYRIVYEDETSDPKRALEKLEQLSRFREDENISRTIQAQIAAMRNNVQGVHVRVQQIQAEFEQIKEQIKVVERNLDIVSEPSRLTGAPASPAAIAVEMDKANKLRERRDALQKELKTLTGPGGQTLRKLQFQQLIVQLAVQKRYIHSLIASGFYRVFDFDLSLLPEAYPQAPGQGTQSPGAGNPSPAGATGATPGAPGAPASPQGDPAALAQAASPGAAAAPIPFIPTVTGLEAHLLTLVRDAMKDREALDNMLASGKLSSAESLLQKMLVAAPYQPELHTIPYEARQQIHEFSQSIRELSEALNSRDYTEMQRLADAIDEVADDVNMSDVRAFATEQSEKALFWIGQAEVALNVGDRQSMQTLMEAAKRHAPLDDAVKQRLEDLQEEANGKSRLADELRLLVKNSDYETVFQRRSEFGTLANSGSDPKLKADFEELIRQEEVVQTALKECDGLADRSSYEEAWLVLHDIDEELIKDPRVIDRQRQVERECQDFVSDYSSAVAFEESGQPALALAWYLTAFAKAQSSSELKDRIHDLGAKLINP